MEDVWNILGVSWGHLSQLCPLWAPCAAPCRGVPDCASTAQQQLQQPCVINMILTGNPVHSTARATRKEINPIQAEHNRQWIANKPCFEIIKNQLLLFFKRPDTNNGKPKGSKQRVYHSQKISEKQVQHLCTNMARDKNMHSGLLFSLF